MRRWQGEQCLEEPSQRAAQIHSRNGSAGSLPSLVSPSARLEFVTHGSSLAACEVGLQQGIDATLALSLSHFPAVPVGATSDRCRAPPEGVETQGPRSRVSDRATSGAGVLRSGKPSIERQLGQGWCTDRWNMVHWYG
jgi:hypothetical protein